jgi:hypothetical protein
MKRLNGAALRTESSTRSLGDAKYLLLHLARRYGRLSLYIICVGVTYHKKETSTRTASLQHSTPHSFTYLLFSYSPYTILKINLL